MTGQEAVSRAVNVLRRELLMDTADNLEACVAALVAERDALLAERDAQTARPALSIEAGDSLLATIAKLTRNAEAIEAELEQAVAERDRLAKAGEKLRAGAYGVGKNVVVHRDLYAEFVAALAVSTP